MRGAAEDGFLPLELVREHLDALEGELLRRSARAFTTRAPASRMPAPQPSRLDLHLRGLKTHLVAAQGEAALRAQSPLYSEAYAGTFVLGRLSPAECLGRGGEIRVRARNRLAVAAALRDAEVPFRVRASDSLSLEAAARVPDGVLLAGLGNVAPRPGLLAAIHDPRASVWVKRSLENIVCGGAPEDSALAILALGRAQARGRSGVPSGFQAWLDLVLGEELFSGALGETLIAAALVGGRATANRIQKQLADAGPTLDLVYALGILGDPETAPALGDLLTSKHPRIAEEALRSLYLMTGELFVEGGVAGVRDDGRLATGAAPDREAAIRFIEPWRHRLRSAGAPPRVHLGAALGTTAGPNTDAPSFRFLRATAMGAPLNGMPALLPGLCADYPRRRGGLFDILPPVASRPIDAPAPRPPGNP